MVLNILRKFCTWILIFVTFMTHASFAVDDKLTGSAGNTTNPEWKRKLGQVNESELKANRNCLDAEGKVVEDGFEFTPSDDPCKTCHCQSGSVVCLSVQCSPPACKFKQVPGECCKFICEDGSDIIITPTDLDPQTNLGMRLIATVVTSLLILCLLLFMILRLRQRQHLINSRRMNNERGLRDFHVYMTNIDHVENGRPYPYQDPPPPYTSGKSSPDLSYSPPPYSENNCNENNRTETNHTESRNTLPNVSETKGFSAGLSNSTSDCAVQNACVNGTLNVNSAVSAAITNGPTYDCNGNYTNCSQKLVVVGGSASPEPAVGHKTSDGPGLSAADVCTVRDNLLCHVLMNQWVYDSTAAPTPANLNQITSAAPVSRCASVERTRAYTDSEPLLCPVANANMYSASTHCDGTKIFVDDNGNSMHMGSAPGNRIIQKDYVKSY